MLFSFGIHKLNISAFKHNEATRTNSRVEYGNRQCDSENDRLRVAADDLHGESPNWTGPACGYGNYVKALVERLDGVVLSPAMPAITTGQWRRWLGRSQNSDSGSSSSLSSSSVPAEDDDDSNDELQMPTFVGSESEIERARSTRRNIRASRANARARRLRRRPREEGKAGAMSWSIRGMTGIKVIEPHLTVAVNTKLTRSSRRASIGLKMQDATGNACRRLCDHRYSQ